jgi:hypothetical protein
MYVANVQTVHAVYKVYTDLHLSVNIPTHLAPPFPVASVVSIRCLMLVKYAGSEYYIPSSIYQNTCSPLTEHTDSIESVKVLAVL